jgi:hypothetical protein
MFQRYNKAVFFFSVIFSLPSVTYCMMRSGRDALAAGLITAGVSLPLFVALRGSDGKNCLFWAGCTGLAAGAFCFRRTPKMLLLRAQRRIAGLDRTLLSKLKQDSDKLLLSLPESYFRSRLPLLAASDALRDLYDESAEIVSLLEKAKSAGDSDTIKECEDAACEFTPEYFARIRRTLLLVKSNPVYIEQFKSFKYHT